MSAYKKYLATVSKHIRSKYPVRKLRKDINLSLGYFLTLVDIENKRLLSKFQVCTLIKDALFFECVQINQEVFDIVLYAGHIAESSAEENLSVSDYQFLTIWLHDTCELYNPDWTRL